MTLNIGSKNLTHSLSTADVGRIDLHSTILTALTALSGGNPGAATALIGLVHSVEKVDPQSALREWGPLLWLDDARIYESQIWMLFKDNCEQDPVKVLLLMRVVQLGLMPIAELKENLESRYSRGGLPAYNWLTLREAVREKIEIFDPENLMKV